MPLLCPQHLASQVLVDLLHGPRMTSPSPGFRAVVGSTLRFISLQFIGGPLRFVGSIMLRVVSPLWVEAVIDEEGGDPRSLRCLVVSCEL